MARKGRARKAGPRNPCGKLKQSGQDPIAPTLWQRMASEAKKKLIDERFGTELGRLFLHQELTSAQFAAGNRVAKVYQTFERLKAKRRSPKSPSYGEGGDHSIAEELMDVETLADLEMSIREASDKFKALDEWLSGRFPRRVCNVLQELCVEDKFVGPVVLPEIREALDQLGLFFGFSTARHALKQQTAAKAAAAPPARQPNIDRSLWIEVVRRLAPHLDEEQLNYAYDVQRTLVARAVFERSKERRKDNVIELPRTRIDRPVLKLPEKG